ncbi:MAG: FHA domain-containing protein [Myxococcota bacterium]
MALLQRHRDGRWINLGARTLVGRYPHCDIQLLDRRVSGHHATFFFDEDQWWIRPQKTTNGTFDGASPLAEGTRHSLEVGMRLRFGSSEQVWEVADLSPPGLVLIDLDGGAIPVLGSRWVSPDGLHVLERDGERWRHAEGGHWIEGGDLLESGEAAWTVVLPTSVRGGSSHTEAEVDHDEQLILEVSADGDRIYRCALQVGGAERELTVRRHTHLLVELADARLASPDDGWLEAAMLRRRLSLSSSQLHLYTHRARAQLREAGLPHDRLAVEVRGMRGSSLLRLGLRAQIQSL